MKNDRQTKVNEAVSYIVQMFESGELPKAIARTTLQKKTGDRPSDHWSLGNQLLMLAADTLDARGYKQWQEVGRQVKKGSKAFSILAPLSRKIKEKNEAGVEEEKVKVIVYGFRTIPVFRYEDTEGDPIELPDYAPDDPPPLMEVAEAWGLRVKYGPYLSDYLGKYFSGSRRIELVSHDVGVFFHELAHAAHDRAGGLVRSAGQNPHNEIVAETVAATLCHMYGYNGYLWNSAEYIKYYAGENPGQAIMRVIADVERVLDEILGTAEALGETA